MTTPASESKTERHFVELATRTLEDQPELRDEARGELMGRLAHSGAKEEEVENALCQLAKTVPQRWSRKGMLAGSVMLLVLGALIAFQLLAMRPELELWPVARGKWGATNEWVRNLPEGDQQLFPRHLLYPRTNFEFLPKPLQTLYPDDPAIYEEHALQYLADFDKLPPDFRETWQRIDPGNGMWLAINAIASDDSTEVFSLLEEAAAYDRFEIRIPELRQRRFALLKVPDEVAGTVVGNAALLRMAGELDPGISLKFKRLPMWEEIEWPERFHGAEGLRTQIANWKRLSSRLVAECQSRDDLTATAESLQLRGDALHDTAATRRLNEEEADLDRLDVEIRNALGPCAVEDYPHIFLYEPALIEFRGAGKETYKSLLNSGIQFQSDELKPGRYAVNAWAERYFALGASILLLFPLAAVWLESCRRGKRVNGLADGLAPVFTAGDAGWLLGLGCGLPLLWYGGITRLTPLGCRDIGVSYFARPIPPAAIQMTATLLLSGVLMFQTGTMLLRKRLGFLGLGGRFPAAGWAVAAVTALLIPLAGAVRWLNRDEQEFLQAIAAACGIPLLWLFWQAGMIVFSPSSGALRGVLLSRRLITPLAVACLVVLGLQPLLLSNERQWLAKDNVSRSDPAHGGIPVGEAMAVERISKALSELLAEPQ